jgi:hypothetical protein
VHYYAPITDPEFVRAANLALEGHQTVALDGQLTGTDHRWQPCTADGASAVHARWRSDQLSGHRPQTCPSRSRRKGYACCPHSSGTSALPLPERMPSHV